MSGDEPTGGGEILPSGDGEGDEPQREVSGAGADEPGAEVYDLFRRGSALLEARDYEAAAVPLERARRLEPDKASIREALGRAYFHAGRYAAARDEFAAVVEGSPVNDFAHFCLGRSLEKTGHRVEARRHLTLAAGLRPDRADYRVYLDRLRAV
ncbi:MAG TPA: tetratricopeptide repeat protein [Thermoleophilaceae bacterium]|nr:tetratricopeptide repeat protein [Thermoleophilaceae bacterium]